MVKKGMPRKMRSKRMTCKRKYKIEKKVKEHNKKAKKEAKKRGKTRPKKDPGIPNLAPFKESILREAEERKAKIEENRQLKKAQRQQRKRDNSLQDLKKDAERRQRDYERKKLQGGRSSAGEASKNLESGRKAYFKEFKKVVDRADVLIEVLDARDPIGSRCLQLEKSVIASGTNKKLVLLLNKIDLVPRENVEKWLKHLRNEFPTVAFKASTQAQKSNLSQSQVPYQLTPKDLLSSSQCLGASAVVKLLSNYCRNADIKTSITVGVVGFPNVGKSSVINSLKRERVCNVGDTPGLTRSMQEIKLAKNIKLLDSPGVVLATGHSEAAMALRNCVKIESMSDPILPVEAILSRCPKDQLMLHYNLPNYESTQEFLTLMATKKGRLKKGGVPDVKQAAIAVLKDWNIGKLPYHTLPPEQHTLPSHINAEIVEKFSKEFKMHLVEKQDEEILTGVTMTRPSSSIAVEGSEPLTGIVAEDEMGVVSESEMGVVSDDEGIEDEDDLSDEGEDDDEMDDGEDADEADAGDLKDVEVDIESNKPTTPSSEAKAKASALKQLMEYKSKQKALRVPQGNQQLNQATKQAFKKMLKKRKRNDKVASKLSDDLTKAMGSLGGSGGDDSYDFGSDFS